MNCEEFRNALAAELDFEPASRAEAAAHAESCAACRAFAEAAARLRGDLELEREVITRGEAGEADGSGARTTVRLAAAGRWRRVAAALLWLAVGAGIGAFAATRGMTRSAAPAPPTAEPRDDSPRYFLAMLERFSKPLAPPPTAPASADTEERIVGEYVAWARSMQERGILVDADRLSDESYAYLHVRDGKVEVEDDLLDGGSHLGGYFLVRAKDLDAAIELARQSPHLKYGGEIEIRAVVRSGGER